MWSKIISIPETGGPSFRRPRSTQDKNLSFKALRASDRKKCRPAELASPAEWVAMKALRTSGWWASALLCAGVATCLAHGQLGPSNTASQGTFPLPPPPSSDPFPKDGANQTDQNALREQERLDSQLRRKQLTQASELLSKIAAELRTELLANPNGIPTDTEIQRIKLIQKLAHLIQENEKAEYQVAAALAKKGGGP
jgi:hypothetical protein